MHFLLQIDDQSTHFGNGLRALGLAPRENTCIFAETKAEWLVCALGCFKQTFPLVTLYANLGEEAVAHGVNQTEVTHVITTHELLPKFKGSSDPTVNNKRNSDGVQMAQLVESLQLNQSIDQYIQISDFQYYEISLLELLLFLSYLGLF